MPQMAPLMWLSLMSMTILSLLMITIYMYFNKTTKSSVSGSSTTSSLTSKWMW
uniref:ATPase 8 n=1 Tax=Cyamus ovalis TaxID=335537 RepID=Q4FC91_CYAOV|nr:ATPase 8 [Cyamus ovalis]AAZ05620.1 ATPase 8 [Cyamus ovalis]AAZ05646.1 ATPase 8 [Cyamus ovalis]